MATCTVSGTVVDPSENGISGITVTFHVSTPTLNSSSTSLFVPQEVSTITASDGTWSLTLSQGISGVVSFDYVNNSTSAMNRYNYSIIVPSNSTATFNSLVTEV